MVQDRRNSEGLHNFNFLVKTVNKYQVVAKTCLGLLRKLKSTHTKRGNYNGKGNFPVERIECQ